MTRSLFGQIMSAPDFQVSIFTVKSSMWLYFHIFLVIWTSCYITSVTGQSQVIGSSQAVLAKVGDDVVLPCHIQPSVNAAKMTVQWSRPDLKLDFVHLLQNGHERSENLNHFYKRRTSLFDEELPHGNISLKLSRVQLSDNATFKCYVPALSSSSLIQLTVEDITGKYDWMTEGGLTGGASAGIAITVTVLLMAAILGYLYWKDCLELPWKKQKKREQAKDKGQAEESLAMIEDQRVALQKEVLDLKEENSDLQSTITALKDGVSAMKKENSDLQKEVSNQNTFISALQEEMSDLDEENSDDEEENLALHGVPSVDDEEGILALYGVQSVGAVQVKVHEEYKFTNKTAGVCAIIHNEEFISLESRTGTDKDADDVARTFSLLGFRVLMCKDQTKIQMKKTLECFSSLNVTELQDSKVKEWSIEEEGFIDLNDHDPPQHGDAFICCIMSHGAIDGNLGTDGQPLYISNLAKIFNGEKCPVLVNKPKVFFSEVKGGEGNIPMDFPSDFLITMASREHYELYRNFVYGSHFTQSVCKQLKKGYDRGDDIQTILYEVIKEVIQKKPPRGWDTKQMPVIRTNTLMKKLVFSKH